MKMKYNELDDFIKAVRKTSIRVIYSDMDSTQQQIKMPQAPRVNEQGQAIASPDINGVVVTFISKLTATDDKNFYCFIKMVAQKKIMCQTDSDELTKAIDAYMGELVGKLHDELPSFDIISGSVEPNLIS